MRIAVCDDDHASLERTSSLLSALTDGDASTAILSFSDGNELIRAHRENAFDIVFLDIVMPTINGMETAHLLRDMDKGVRIVFLTSSVEYAVESYSVKASNYLIKPVDPKHLSACMEDLERELATRTTKRTLAVKGARSVLSLDPAEIEFLEARGKRVRIRLSSGEVIESIEPFHTLEDKLDSGIFLRTHRSFLVNANHIFTFTTEEITTRSGEKIPISRSYRADFKGAYFSAMFGSGEDAL